MAGLGPQYAYRRDRQRPLNIRTELKTVALGVIISAAPILALVNYRTTAPPELHHPRLRPRDGGRANR